MVSRHIVVDPEKITVKMNRGRHVSTLEIDIEIQVPEIVVRSLRHNPRQRHPLDGAQKETQCGEGP